MKNYIKKSYKNTKIPTLFLSYTAIKVKVIGHLQKLAKPIKSRNIHKIPDK